MTDSRIFVDFLSNNSTIETTKTCLAAVLVRTDV